MQSTKSPTNWKTTYHKPTQRNPN